MSKNGKNIIVIILLLILVLGIFSISVPEPVTGEGEPPIPYGPNGEIPAGYSHQIKEQTPNEEIDASLHEDPSNRMVPDNDIMSNLNVASYASVGFNTFQTVYYQNAHGCIENSTNTNRYVTTNVILPHGSRIYKIELNGYDGNDTESLHYNLTRYEYSGDFVEYIEYLNSGIEYDGGTFSEIKLIDHTVNNLYYSYVIDVFFPPYNSNKTIRFCSALIYYIPPSPFVNAMPMITNQ
jgi:hypothetical protein